MPLMKLCRCGKVIDFGQRYCDACAQKAEQSRKEYYKQYDIYQRDQKAREFYSSPEWEKVRKQAMIRDYGLCQDCLKENRITPADVVDHIKPIRHFWHLRLTLENLRCLCNRHHAAKTAEDRRRYGA